MNVKKLKAIRAYCKLQRFDEKIAIKEFLGLPVSKQEQLIVEIKNFIESKRVVGSRGRRVRIQSSNPSPLVSTDTVISC